MYAAERGRTVFIIQNPARCGPLNTNIIPSFSAMFVRNIIPVCSWIGVIAISEIISSRPIHSLMVASFGCALVGRAGTAGAEFEVWVPPPAWVQPCTTIEGSTAVSVKGIQYRFMADRVL